MPASRLVLMALAAAVASCASAREARIAAEEERYGDVLVARYAELDADPRTAAERLLRAIEKQPGDAALAQRAVETALSAGDFALASAAAQSAARFGATSSAGRLTLATGDLARGRPQSALRRLERADGAAFDRLTGRVLKAWSLAATGRETEALALLDDDAGPVAQVLAVQRGFMLERMGRPREAIAVYEEASRAGLRLAVGAIRRGEALERLGRRDEAIAVYEASLEDFENPEVLRALDRAKAGGPPPPLATSPAQGAALGVFTLSVTLLAAAEPEAAIPYLTLALALDPDLAVARVAYAEAVGDLGRGAEARDALAQVPESSPFFEAARIRAAYSYAQEERMDEAVGAAREAATTGGAASRRALADILRDAERWEEAARLYDGLIAEDEAKPGDPDWRLYFSRGAALERSGRWAQAEADLLHAKELAPEQPEVLNYLGYSWIDRGERLKEALTLIEKAVELRPQSGHIVDSLGWAHYRLGDFERALRYLERAAELNPEDPTINDHLGDAYWQVGRRLEARFQWRKALAFAGDDFDTAPVERKLAVGLSAEPAPGAQASR